MSLAVPVANAAEAAPVDADRRELLRAIPINEQWKILALQPRLMRTWHALAGVGSGTLVGVVYVFGWRGQGASVLMVLPAIMYTVGAFATVAALNIQGLITPVNHVGPLQGILQMYCMVFPLFQPVHKV